MENITVSPTKWEILSNNDGWDTVLSWCLNENNESVLVRIENYPCSFYYILPRQSPGSDYHKAKDVYEKFLKGLKHNSKNLLPFNMENIVRVNSNGINPDNLISSLVQDNVYLKLEFKNQNTTKHARDLATKEKLDGIYPGGMCKYETNTIKKLLNTKNIKYCDWYNCKAILIANELDKISCSAKEYLVDYNSIIPSNINIKSKPLWLDFSIHVHSDDQKSFPVPSNEKDVIHSICMVFRRDGDTIKEWKQYCITQSVFLIKKKEIMDTVSIIKVDNEKELLCEYARIILKENPDFLSGYNVLYFDNRYLDLKMERHIGSALIVGRLKFKLRNTTIIRTNYISDMYIIDAPGRSWFDMFQYFKSNYIWNSYSLLNAVIETSTIYPKLLRNIHITKQFEMYDSSKNCKLNHIKNSETIINQIILLGDNLENKDALIERVIQYNITKNWTNMGALLVHYIYYNQLTGYISNNINLWEKIKNISSKHCISPEKVPYFKFNS